MKRLLITIILLISPTIMFSQYWYERTTEHNFENSNIFFNPQFLNPYGMENLKNVSVGLLDDPFLNIQLNPAIMPIIKNGSTEVYLDFRGDRTESKLVSNYIVPEYYSPLSSIALDYRQITETRSESEPIVSLGIITYPFESLEDNFYIGGTFQYLHAKDNFYNPLFGLYSNNFYADSYNVKLAEHSSIPMIDRSVGKNEMVQRGIVFNVFAGYRLSPKFSLGLNINTVSFERVGDYVSNNYYEYDLVNNNSNNNLKSRSQDYDHINYSLGFKYDLDNKTYVGLKGGYLDGNVDQNHIQNDYSLNSNNQPEVSDTWYYHLADYKSNQTWKHDGSSNFLTFNFSKIIKKSRFNFHYKYTSTQIDAFSTSNLLDSSFTSNKWSDPYNSNSGESRYKSKTTDIRNGQGDRNTNSHNFMISANWNTTERIKIHTGFYIDFTHSSISNLEKALYNNNNDYVMTGTNSVINKTTLSENKKLNWNYKNKHTSFQIPIIFDFTLNKTFQIMLGISRVFHDWSIKSSTSVFFNERKSNNNGVVVDKNNFIEKYTEPTKNYTEDYTDVFSEIRVSITNELNASLLINPEFEDTFRISQWWLSFRANF